MKLAWLARILARLLRPGASSRFVGGCFVFLLRLAGPRRATARKNLNIVLPGASKEEIERLVNETYAHLVWVGVEFLALRRDPAQVLDWVEASGDEILDSFAGKGAILITGHVGNWEITAAWLAQRGYNVTAIVREPDDIGERGLIEEMRTHAGVRCLPRSASMTNAVSILKRGEFLGILPDQHGGGEGIMAPFFGVMTSTSQGPAVFAYLTGRPLIPIFSHRISPFHHRVRIAPPISWEKGATRDETILHITKLINVSLENMIKEAPGQWLAQHRRFREFY